MSLCDLIFSFHFVIEASTAYKFKKVCVECRERHTSLHHCRKVYRHTAPEWTAERRKKLANVTREVT